MGRRRALCGCHTNHHVLPGMAAHETATADELHNSTCRHERIAALLGAERGRLDADTLKTVLRDHGNRPHSICAHPGERVSYSFASIISDLDAGRMEIAVGPPCEHDYVRYEVGVIATELWRLDAVELADLIRRRQAPCREAIEAGVARLDAVNPRINAVVRPLHEQALAEATAADQALARGGPVRPSTACPSRSRSTWTWPGSRPTTASSASRT